MKVKFSKSVQFTPEWNKNRELPEKDQIKLVLKPLLFDDLLAIMDALGGNKIIQEVKESGAEAVRERVDMPRVIKEVGALLPKYVTEFSGLEDDVGPITIEEITQYPAFLGLAIEVLMKLAEISSPSEETEGNSEGQPG